MFTRELSGMLCNQVLLPSEHDKARAVIGDGLVRYDGPRRMHFRLSAGAGAVAGVIAM